MKKQGGPSGRWRRVRQVWAVLGLLAMTAFVFSFQARGLPSGVLETDDHVRVTRTGSGYEFTPVGPVRATGLVFFPGGMVQLRAYAPLARAIAEAGHPVVLVELPFLGRHAPSEEHKQEAFRRARVRMPSILTATDWVIGGHSFGGKLAARFAFEHPDSTAGLILIATTHPRDLDLSGAQFAVTRIYGTRDGIAPEAKMRANASNLPSATRWIAIEGGNHAQFGFYGPQLGGGRATISRAEQQRLAVEAILDVLR